MSPKRSELAERLSLAKQEIEADDQPFIDFARALLKAGFLFSNHPKRPYQAFDLNLSQVDVLAALANSGDASLSCSEIAEKTLSPRAASPGSWTGSKPAGWSSGCLRATTGAAS